MTIGKEKGDPRKIIDLSQVWTPEQKKILIEWSNKAAVSPHKDKRLVLAENEFADREAILNTVRVDELGIARCINPSSEVETALAAIKIDDQKNASLVSLTQAEEGHLRFVLPEGFRIARIGFFIGVSLDKTSTVLRMGEYPGEPLTTEVITDRKVREVPYILNGLRDNEQDERGWARQLGLEELGFNKGRMRGIFNRGLKMPTSDFWKDSPLLVAEGDVPDFVTHPDSAMVKLDEYQLLVYGPQMIGTNLRGTRGGITAGWSKQSQSRYNPLQPGGIGDLEGAFRIVIATY